MMGTMNEERFLKECLVEKAEKLKENLPNPPKQDFRELSIIYYCKKPESSNFEECLHFFPTPTGNCTWAYDNYSQPICRKEVV